MDPESDYPHWYFSVVRKPINGNRQRDAFPHLTEILLLFTDTRLFFGSQPTQNCNSYTTKTRSFRVMGNIDTNIRSGQKNLFDLGAASGSAGFKCVTTLILVSYKNIRYCNECVVYNTYNMLSKK